MIQNSHPVPNRPARLLTRDEVIAELTREIEQASLTEVAARYKITAQQLSDIRYGRANLSKKALAKLRYEMVCYFRKIEKKDKEPQVQS